MLLLYLPGSFSFDFVGERFINAYHNISNIILHISKKGHQQDPAVLLVAHHDSPVGSPGTTYNSHAPVASTLLATSSHAACKGVLASEIDGCVNVVLQETEMSVGISQFVEDPAI